MRAIAMKDKYLFIGDIMHNSGPSNVNKGIFQNRTSKFLFIKSSNKWSSIIEAFIKIILCKVIIVSGISRQGIYIIRLAKMFGKKAIYIMHGCCDVEAELNCHDKDERAVNWEQGILRKADLILPVSQRYSKFIKEKYPQYKNKISFLHNGVEYNEKKECPKRIKGKIIAVGGDRKLKNNVTVAKAMKKHNINGILNVYGHLYEPDKLPKSENIKFKGLVPQDELYKEMESSELYILNSIYESFALSVFDALFCGCSILVSNVAGALELLDVTEHDVIYDPMDEEEIASKIKYLLDHPNNERLIKNINLDDISYKNEVKKLEAFCDKLAAGEKIEQ